ncbi:N-acetylneuraminate synthase family protein [Candidatus Parcubacteria bacterium]|nr:N-acetylneuraminate synthase family protein [Candidatus Parcubacteria bacterium]
MNPQAKKYDFENLFTLEMANNHQGSVPHGKKIINEMGAIAREFGIKAAVKLQFRNLNTFIHPTFRENKDNKHIARFLSTELTESQFKELVDEVRKEGMITMVTPFDEESVGMIDRMNIEIVKIASCSAHDWPLLEKIASLGRPIICSVGGLTIKEVDRVVSFLEHRGATFALMHCVAIYPTPPEKLHLNQIEVMRDRYPHITVGFSTHEPPENTSVIGLAFAKGARIFEKHVGVPTDTIKLNAYSANPDEVRAWVKAYKQAVDSCGHGERVVEAAEIADLRSLMRGVYAKKDIKAGMPINRDDIFFAMPLLPNDHMRSGRFKNGFIADRDYKTNEPLGAGIEPERPTKKDIIYSTIHATKGMLNTARIPVGHDFMVEISHHYGLEKFHEIGCVIIDCINREYAKKLIVQLPGQYHPVHYHKVKDETFQILSGTMEVDIEGKKRMLYAGDTLWVPRGVWHGFKTDTGVIFEEISTTSLETLGDSFYLDKQISSIPREARKTKLLNWGRHQFDNVE